MLKPKHSHLVIAAAIMVGGAFYSSIATAEEVAIETSCESVLPLQPPILVETGEPLQVILAAPTADAVLSLPGAQRVNAIMQGQDAVFAMPSGLVAGTEVGYSITVITQDGSSCATPNGLSFFLSSDGATLPGGEKERASFVKASTLLLQYASQNDADAVTAICSTPWPSGGSPCFPGLVFPAPSETSTDLGQTATKLPANLPSVEVVHASGPSPLPVLPIDPIGGPNGPSLYTGQCKTIRFYGESYDVSYWSRYGNGTQSPGSFAVATAGSATSEFSPADNSVSMTSSINRGNPLGGSDYSSAYGTLGFALTVSGAPGAFTVQPAIQYRVLGREQVQVYGVPQAPGSAQSNSQIYVRPFSTNFAGQGGDGSDYLNRIDASTGAIAIPFFDTRDVDDYRGVYLPSIVTDIGQPLAAYIYTRAEAGASSSFFAVAGADAYFNAPTRQVKANFADFTITSPADVYWNSDHCAF